MTVPSIHQNCKLVFVVFTAVAVLVSCGPVEKKQLETGNDPLNSDYDIAAYVWPSCHNDERYGDLVWPEGTGEWEIIKQGTPRFEGHYQPKVPLWGYENDNDPKVMEKWINAAVDHGVNVFIFDWYWYEGGPFLESCIKDGFLKAENNKEIKFYVMWANHSMPHKLINPYDFDDYKTSRWPGAVDMENFKIIVERIITQYFHKPNYYKIDGKPVFSLFLINEFIKGMGSAEQAREAIDYFRAEVKKAGFPGLHLQQIVFDRPTDEILAKIKKLGVNSVTSYNWDSPHPEDYIHWGVQALDRREDWHRELAKISIPYLPNASIGWDDSPRFPSKQKDRIVHQNKTPEAFGGFLKKAMQYCDEHPEQPGLITLFAWNEWIEGSYLLPDIKYGYSYLETVKKTLQDKRETKR